MSSRVSRFFHHPFTRLVLSLVVTVALMLLFFIISSSVGLRMGHREHPLLSSLVNATATLMALLGVGRYLERRRPAELGLALRGAARQLGWGALLGAGLMSIVVGALAVAGSYQLADRPPVTTAQLTREALAWLAIFSAAGLFEELLFRGIIFRLLEEWLGSAAALVLGGTWFGLSHIFNDHATWLSAATIALDAGLLLGGSYMLTRSLWLPVGIHVAWNWTQSILFGVPVSGLQLRGLLAGRLVGPEAWTGGAFGVEAGGMASLFTCLAAGAILVATVRRGHWRPFLPSRRAQALQSSNLSESPAQVP